LVLKTRTEGNLTRNLASGNRSHVSSALKLTTVSEVVKGKGLNGEGSILDTGSGGCCSGSCAANVTENCTVHLLHLYSVPL